MSRRLLPTALLATALAVSACSSEGADDAAPASTAADGVTTTTDATGRGCDAGATGDLQGAEPVEGVASDWWVRSFDGTAIRVHWFPTDATGDEPAPTVLMGPGWSLPGETSLEGSPIMGSLGIGPLNEAGYNVLTWDPRGFGESEGVVGVDDPEVEGRDVRVLLDWVAGRDGVLLDADGDPRVGMIGVSYGGGIQLVTAGQDCRVDAIVPNMAWHSLTTSLFRNETYKQGWGSQLVSFAAGAELDPHVTSAAERGAATGVLDPADVEWFAERGPDELVERISAPTLLLAGTVDTLFTLDEAVENFRTLERAGTTVSMIWYCGGHGVCLTTPNPDLTWTKDATLAWLDRWVKGDETVDTGPRIRIVDQHGQVWAADELPANPSMVGAGSSDPLELALEETPAEPVVPPSGDVLGGIVAAITPSPAKRAAELPWTADDDSLIVGAPILRLRYSGTVAEGERPTRVFAQIVDPATGTVVGAQVTPIPVTLDGTEQEVELRLETIAHRVTAGETLVLQLIATSPSYAVGRLGGSVTFTEVSLELPVVAGFRPV